MQEPTPLPVPVPLDPARTEHLRLQLAAVVAAMFDAITAPGALDRSMEGRSPGSKMMARVLRSQLPTLRRELSARVSEVDGFALEAMIGAMASALEATLYYAPGTPAARFHFVWSTDETTGRPKVDLVPDDAPAGELEAPAG